MSAPELTYEVHSIIEYMTSTYADTFSNVEGMWIVTPHFLEKVSKLMRLYGQFIGKAKAENSSYLTEINKIDNDINSYFEAMLKSPQRDYCFKLTGLITNKISEQISFIESIKLINPEKNISNKAYQEALSKISELNNINEFLIKHNGLPELNEILEKSKNIGIPVDEYWVLTLCSVNLMEAIVNKKLESLNEKTEGNFKEKYNKLSDAIKKKEQRDISKMVPFALYDNIRNKLDHASNSNKVTPKEARQINEIIQELIKELFIL